MIEKVFGAVHPFQECFKESNIPSNLWMVPQLGRVLYYTGNKHRADVVTPKPQQARVDEWSCEFVLGPVKKLRHNRVT